MKSFKEIGDVVENGLEDLILSSCSRTTSCKFLVDSRLICQFKKWHSSEKNLLLSHGSNFVQDDEFLIMHDLFEPKNQDFPHEAYAKINLESWPTLRV